MGNKYKLNYNYRSERACPKLNSVTTNQPRRTSFFARFRQGSSNELRKNCYHPRTWCDGRWCLFVNQGEGSTLWFCPGPGELSPVRGRGHPLVLSGGGVILSSHPSPPPRQHRRYPSPPPGHDQGAFVTPRGHYATRGHT